MAAKQPEPLELPVGLFINGQWETVGDLEIGTSFAGYRLALVKDGEIVGENQGSSRD
ncbi:MAG: hypothetical protein WAS05_00155 [Candidatus Nanopelagicales bacterium]